MVLERIADFLHQLLDRHNHSDQRQHAMSADLKTIIDKLNEQGSTIASQGRQIDKLISDRDAKEQADLDKIMSLIESNGSASAANADKLTAALAPSDGGSSSSQGSAASITGSVAAATTAPTSTVVVTGDAPIPTGAVLSGPGISDGTTASDVAVTTAVDGSAVSTITLSQPTTEDHVGDQTETLTATPAQ